MLSAPSPTLWFPGLPIFLAWQPLCLALCLRLPELFLAKYFIKTSIYELPEPKHVFTDLCCYPWALLQHSRHILQTPRLTQKRHTGMTHLVLDQFQEISPAGTVSPVGLKELRWTEAGSCVHLPGTCPLVTSAQGQDKLCNWTGTAKAWMCLGESRVQVLLSGPRGYRCAWHICSQMNLAGQEVGKRLIGPSCTVKFGSYSKSRDS